MHALCIETAPYIYYIEGHPHYAAKMDAIFAFIEAQEIQIYTSVLTLTETLVKPIQRNDEAVVNAYRALLTDTSPIHLMPVTPPIAEKAAYLRAQYNLRTPDSLHVALAIEMGCEAFLTNDKGIKRVTDLVVLVLDELELP